MTNTSNYDKFRDTLIRVSRKKDNGYYVIHINGDKLDNRSSNLRWEPFPNDEYSVLYKPLKEYENDLLRMMTSEIDRQWLDTYLDTLFSEEQQKFMEDGMTIEEMYEMEQKEGIVGVTPAKIMCETKIFGVTFGNWHTPEDVNCGEDEVFQDFFYEAIEEHNKKLRKQNLVKHIGEKSLD